MKRCTLNTIMRDDRIVRCIAYDLMCGAEDEINACCGVSETDVRRIASFYSARSTCVVELAGKLSDELWNSLFDDFGLDVVHPALLEFCDFSDDFASAFAQVGSLTYMEDGATALELLEVKTRLWASTSILELLPNVNAFSWLASENCRTLAGAYDDLVPALTEQCGHSIAAKVESARDRLIPILQSLVSSIRGRQYAEELVRIIGSLDRPTGSEPRDAPESSN